MDSSMMVDMSPAHCDQVGMLDLQAGMGDRKREWVRPSLGLICEKGEGTRRRRRTKMWLQTQMQLAFIKQATMFSGYRRAGLANRPCPSPDHARPRSLRISKQPSESLHQYVVGPE